MACPWPWPGHGHGLTIAWPWPSIFLVEFSEKWHTFCTPSLPSLYTSLEYLHVVTTTCFCTGPRTKAMVLDYVPKPWSRTQDHGPRSMSWAMDQDSGSGPWSLVRGPAQKQFVLTAYKYSRNVYKLCDDGVEQM